MNRQPNLSFAFQHLMHLIRGQLLTVVQRALLVLLGLRRSLFKGLFSVQCARVGKSVYYSDRPVMDSCCRASPTFDQFPALNVSPANFGLIFYQQP